MEILMITAKIKNIDELKEHFTFDAQFIDMDGAFYEQHDSDEKVPYDLVLEKIADKDLKMETMVEFLGAGLIEFDWDFEQFNSEVNECSDGYIVSMAVGLK